MPLVQSKPNNTSPGNDAIAAFDSAVAVGRFLVVEVACYTSNADGVITVSDDINGDWEVVYSNRNTTNISALAYFENSAAGTPTVTVHSSGTGDQYITAVQSEWSGMVTSGALDVFTSATGASTTGTTGTTGTTSQADTVSFAVISHENDEDMSTPAGFTSLQLITDNATFQPATQSYRVNSAAGAQSASITFTGTKNWVGGIAAFKVAAAGAPLDLEQSAPIGLSGTLSASGDPEIRTPTYIEQSGATALAGSIGVSGDIAFQIKRWRVPTNAPESTAVHVIVFSGSNPTYGVLAQGNATVQGGAVVIPATGTIGTKAFALVHNFDDDEETTSINGGPCVAELIDAG